MTIWEIVQTALEPLGLPVFASQELVATGQALPAQYLVHQLISSTPDQAADDQETLRSNRVQVTIWSTTGFTGQQLADIRNAMTAAGFTRSAERELPFDQTAKKYGFALDFFFEEESAQ